jgi:transcriptional regulator GlxA family with amidase domain
MSTLMSEKTLVVGILHFPGFEVLDVFGPGEVFGSTRFLGQKVEDPGPRPFQVVYLAETANPVPAGNGGGASVLPDAVINATLRLDIVLVPGGLGTRTQYRNRALIDWIHAQDSRVELMTSVCTGAVLLAQAGLLHGLRATTNHAAYDWVVQHSPPGIHWTKALRWVDEGRYITSGGVSAGTEMACHLVERLYGPEVVDATVKGMEYNWERDPQKQPPILLSPQ